MDKKVYVVDATKLGGATVDRVIEEGRVVAKVMMKGGGAKALKVAVKGEIREIDLGDPVAYDTAEEALLRALAEIEAGMGALEMKKSRLLLLWLPRVVEEAQS